MTQPRQPKGTPTGGQFAPGQHSEPDAELELVDEATETETSMREEAADWASGEDATIQYATTGAVTPDGAAAWQALWTDREQNGEFDDDLEGLVAHIVAKGNAEGTALDQQDFIHAISPNNPLMPEDADALWDDYRDHCNTHGPMRPDDWAFQRGEAVGLHHAPPPPIGTHIGPDRARSLPSYTELMVRFENIPDREFHIMARGIPQWHSGDRGRSRRFTNLDTGSEVFIGGSDSPHGYGRFDTFIDAYVIKHP